MLFFSRSGAATVTFSHISRLLNRNLSFDAAKKDRRGCIDQRCLRTLIKLLIVLILGRCRYFRRIGYAKQVHGLEGDVLSQLESKRCLQVDLVDE